MSLLTKVFDSGKESSCNHKHASHAYGELKLKFLSLSGFYSRHQTITGEA